MGYRQVAVISGKGSETHQFTDVLSGITVDRAGLIYAVGDSKLKVFDAQGRLQRQWPTARPGYCVAADTHAAIYVGEAGQIEKFDAQGKLETTWQDAERLGLVTAIGFFGDNVLIADANGRCIRRYDSRGEWQNDIGKDNNTRGFLIPNGYLDFAVDDEGIIHACNPAKFRIQRYTLTGELLGHFGKFGTSRPEDFPGCCNPTNVTLTPQGHVVVTEKAKPRMKVYDASGKMLAFVGSEAFDANCKNMDVAVDSRGRIYVVDTVRLTILVFESDASDRPTKDHAAAAGAKGAQKP